MIGENKQAPWSQIYTDLLSERYGGQALTCNDEFFAEANNLVKRSAPEYRQGEYTDRGKWMDGWESRRRRSPGFDWCILRLGLRGRIRGVVVNTTHFKGNAPEKITLEACYSEDPPNEQTLWSTIIDEASVAPDSENEFPVHVGHVYNHVRLKIFPDGGVARLRVWGEPTADWSNLLENELVDLAASVNGGRAIACSDMFFSPMNNIIAPGRGVNMGDGWETRRRRGPGYDWLICQLACAGQIQRVLIDTYHFKGNFPESFSLQATNTERLDITAPDIPWDTLIERHPLTAHSEHVFQELLQHRQDVFTHVRLNIFPDGGVSRLRIFGYPKLEYTL